MAIYHNIVKTEGFEPKNAKNVGDFDSVGELYTWLEKRGWRPKWHTEPQDSVDFTIKNIQKYL
jgi:thiamine pyrophosphokinase